MKTIYSFTIFSMIFLLMSICSSCVKNDNFAIPETACSDEVIATKTAQEIFNMATGSALKYGDEDVIEGFVVSSDQEGNFFKNLSIQTLDGSIGFVVPIDQTDLYTIYNPGRKVYVKLFDNYTQIDHDALEIGALFIDNFQNEQVGRISNPEFQEIVLKSCEVIDEEELVTSIAIDQITDAHLHTLVEISGVQFEEAALDHNLYDRNNDINGATAHKIQDSIGTSLFFKTSSFADFANKGVPDGNGTIRGVLTKDKGGYQLMARSINDLNLNNERRRFGFVDTITGTPISIADLRSLFTGSDTTLSEPFFIEGIITLSGFDSNNISEINAFIQDDSGAISLSFNTPTSLKRGNKVKIGLKDVLLNRPEGLLEANLVQSEHVMFVAENEPSPIPVVITLEQLLTGDFQSQLVQLDSLQFENETGIYDGDQEITDCIDIAVLSTESEASFSNTTYPKGNGAVFGLATAFNGPKLLIRDTQDTAEMTGDRCVVNTESIMELFFSELADPNNNSGARFIELYNSSTKNINLNGWTIKRYTNANTTSTATIDLSGNSISPGQAFVIAAQSAEFATVFGFAPDLEGGVGSPADSNGDDNLELVDPHGNIIDIFGIPGEDGSGTNHEFEDGRALRNPAITLGNPNYTFDEWQLWNDTGDAGTTNAPQDAPGVFTPGER